MKKLVINYINNQIELTGEKIFSMEIENRRYFYRIVSDLYTLSNEPIEEILYFDGLKEINVSGKINIINNYFKFEEIFKAYNLSLIKKISNNINEEVKNSIFVNYNSFVNELHKNISNIDIALNINSDISFENLLKNVKLNINLKDDLLDNLFLLIDIEKELNVNKLLIFINLKQYLSKEELYEFYKYSLYNNVNILLIDSQSYGISLENETKLIIDGDLEEFMLK